MSGHWESGTFVPSPTEAPGGMSVEQTLDSRTPPPSPGLLHALAVLHGEMVAASRDSTATLGSAQNGDQIPFVPNPNNPVRASAIGASADFLLKIDDEPGLWREGTQYAPPIGGAALTQHDLDTLLVNARQQDYPFSPGVVLSGLQAPLSQAEADFLNAHFGAAP